MNLEFYHDPNGAPRRNFLENLAIMTRFMSERAIEVSNGSGFEDGLHPYIDGPVNWGIKGSLGSLKELKVLRTLEVALPVLLGWHVHRTIAKKCYFLFSTILSMSQDLSDQ